MLFRPYEAIVPFDLFDVAAALADYGEEAVCFWLVLGARLGAVAVVVDHVVDATDVVAFVAEVIDALTSVACHAVAERALGGWRLEAAEMLVVVHGWSPFLIGENVG